MITLVDACFLINVKKTDLHQFYHQIFPEIVISSQIEDEVVQKGMELQKIDAKLSQQQIHEGLIRVEPVEEGVLQPIAKVIHGGEASLLAICDQLNDQEFHVGTDDKIFWRYLKYVYAVQTGKDPMPFSSLDVVTVLFRRQMIAKDEARTILQQLTRVGAHAPDAILEVYAEIEKAENGG